MELEAPNALMELAKAGPWAALAGYLIWRQNKHIEKYEVLLEKVTAALQLFVERTK
jgi:hypothetical protein